MMKYDRIAGLLILIFFFILFASGIALAEGLSGNLNVRQSNLSIYEDGDKTSEAHTLNQNYFFSLNKAITPMISYQLYLRTNLLDASLEDSAGQRSDAYKRTIEPAIELSLRNSSYSFTTGYRRTEEWPTASLSNDQRVTTLLYYSRFDVTPHALPSLSLDYNRREEFDYGDSRQKDLTEDEYSLSSSYRLPSRDIDMRYYLNYTHRRTRTPLDMSEKSINDSFNGNYSVGYNGTFMKEKGSWSVAYKGVYSRDKSRVFVTETGNFVLERSALGGLYIQNVNTSVALGSLSALVDDDKSVSSGIDLSTGVNHQIGISVSPEESVDRLYIYVNADISGDGVLTSIANWQVLSNTANQATGWTVISISSITATAVDTTDPLNPVYRYELIFSSSQSAAIFKAVNNAVSAVSNVFVTEIEAYGTTLFLDKEEKTVSTSFIQGIDLGTSLNPLKDITLTLSYSIDRSDRNPVSLPQSFGGIFGNIFSDSFENGKSNFKSTVTRNYAASAVWHAHRLLTTSAGYHRNENFDNLGDRDVSSDTYELSFMSEPLPTLSSNLSLQRSHIYEFSDHTTTNSSVLLSISAELYRDVHMINDISYATSESMSTSTKSHTYVINGSVNAKITRRTSGTLNYNFSRAKSDSSVSDSKSTFASLSYRLSRYLNLTGNFRFSEIDDDVTTSEGFLFDWRPMPAFQVNMNYFHRDADPGSVQTDNVSGLMVWHVTRFADIRFSSTYSIDRKAKKTENFSYNTTLNCRF
jgi:hypothetical protein